MRLLSRTTIPATLALLVLLGGLAAAWLVADAPREPLAALGLLRLDALAALVWVAAGGAALGEAFLGRSRPWRDSAALLALAAAPIVTPLPLTGGLVLAAALLRGARELRAEALGAALAAAGLAMVALGAGEWRYQAAGAGAGLGSPAFGLVLAGALLAVGAGALPGGRPPAGDYVAALGGLTALLRMFSLGPWNLGWQIAALALGVGAAIWAAWRAAEGPGAARAWLALWLGAGAIAGAGLASGAGLAAAAFAALCLGPLGLGLGLGRPQGAARWLLAPALPLSATFVAAWMQIAAALAAGVGLAAAGLWAAALLACLPFVRAEPAAPHPGARGLAGVAGPPRAVAAGLISLGLGAASPAVFQLLLRPLVAQLQGGLTPFGDLALWPWAGLLARSAGGQTVATLPSLALVGLMLILGALAWVGARLGGGGDG